MYNLNNDEERRQKIHYFFKGIYRRERLACEKFYISVIFIEWNVFA